MRRGIALSPSMRAIVAAWDGWLDHRTIRLGAGLAYYGLVALVPLTVVVVYVAGLVVGPDQLGDRLAELVPGSADEQQLLRIADLVDAVSARMAASNAGLVGVAAAVVSASFAAVAIEDSFGVIWEIPRGRGWQTTLRRRLLSVGVVVGLSLLIAGVLVVQSVLSAVAGLVGSGFVETVNGTVLLPTLGLGTLFALVLLLFKLVPDTRVSWRASLVGAGASTGAVVVGAWILGIYLHRFARPTLVGAAATVGGILAVAYYAAQAFLAGAELTAALDNTRERP